MKVILIEDELILGETLMDAFEILNVEAIWYKGVQEFKEGLKQTSDEWSHIVCDFYLKDGTLKDIHSMYVDFFDPDRRKTIPFIASSATAAESDLSFIEKYCEELLAKPFSIHRLIEVIERTRVVG